MQQGAPLPAAPSGISVGVGPITIPSYLDRPHIVTRSNPPEIDLAEFRRWAEPLESAIPRILAEDLGKFLGTENVAVFPWPPANAVDYQVLVEVVRMDGALGDHAVLQTRWTILTQAGKHVYRKKNSSISIPLKDASYESFVSAQSQAIAGLGEEIALEIKAASQASSRQ